VGGVCERKWTDVAGLSGSESSAGADVGPVRQPMDLLLRATLLRLLQAPQASQRYEPFPLLLSNFTVLPFTFAPLLRSMAPRIELPLF